MEWVTDDHWIVTSCVYTILQFTPRDGASCLAVKRVNSVDAMVETVETMREANPEARFRVLCKQVAETVRVIDGWWDSDGGSKASAAVWATPR